MVIVAVVECARVAAPGGPPAGGTGVKVAVNVSVKVP